MKSQWNFVEHPRAVRYQAPRKRPCHILPQPSIAFFWPYCTNCTTNLHYFEYGIKIISPIWNWIYLQTPTVKLDHFLRDQVEHLKNIWNNHSEHKDSFDSFFSAKISWFQGFQIIPVYWFTCKQPLRCVFLLEPRKRHASKSRRFTKLPGFHKLHQ